MGIPTFIFVLDAPPATVAIGEPSRVEGWLADVDGNPIMGLLPIELYVDGAKVEEGWVSDGRWDFTIPAFPTRGAHTVHVEFPGDATYDPSSSDVYTIVVIGQETYTIVDSPPPADIGVSEPFYVGGELSGELTGKTVELWEDGVLVKLEVTGVEGWIGTFTYGRWRFSAPAFQTLGTHNLEIKFSGDEIHEPSSSGVLEVVVRESEVVPTIENVTVPTKVEPSEPWSGYFHMCNRGIGTGNVRAVISGDVTGETPTIVMGPGACQTVAIGGVGPSIFTIRTGV